MPYEVYNNLRLNKNSYINIKTWGSITYYSDNKLRKPKLGNKKRKAIDSIVYDSCHENASLNKRGGMRFYYVRN